MADVLKKWYGKAVMMQLTKGIMERLEESSQVVEKITKRSMKEGGSFKIQSDRVKGGRKVVIRSDPGEPPYKQTKKLHDSIKHGLRPKSLSAWIGTNVKYAKALELGYQPRNLKARPFLRPALHRARKYIMAIFARPIKGLGEIRMVSDIRDEIGSSF